ncbi:MAG: hypothetical protein HXY24_18840, partial [Rubrivivax sp.]|nr:hypothetical protein [Rubrivivax sp.]
LAEIERATDHLAEALAAARRSVELAPLHLQGYLLLGEVLEAAGDVAAARAAYERLDRLANSPELREAAPLQKREYLFEPTQGYALMRLGTLAEQAGDRAVARDAYTRALADFALYEKTWRKQLEAMAALPASQQRELLALSGLHEDERAEVRALVTTLEERLRALGPAP